MAVQLWAFWLLLPYFADLQNHNSTYLLAIQGTDRCIHISLAFTFIYYFYKQL